MLRSAKGGTQMKVLVIHGKGMELRGKEKIEIFGTMTLPEYDEHIRRYQFRCDCVFINVPPANVRHMRFQQPCPR